MDNNQNEKNGKGKMSAFVKKASDITKKVASDVKNSAAAMSEKKKATDYEKRMKKYNPLFPEQYESEDFNIPNMIVIVDDAVRRDIDVCEGAIGWRDNSSGIEVLYLYDEWVTKSGIEFIPNAICDTSYYVDPYDRSKFIRVDCIFNKTHEEKLAELEHIAYSLGAKSCSIEIVETSEQFDSVGQKSSTKVKAIVKSSASVDKRSSSESFSGRSGKTVTYFEGNNTPKKPNLKWYAHDDNILRLVEMRCSGDNAIKSKTLELFGSTTATMSQKIAISIDATLKKLGGGSSLSMERQAVKENSSKMILEIEF